MPGAHAVGSHNTFHYPPTIGGELKHWVQFNSFTFKGPDKEPNLDVALYLPPDALSTSYKSNYESTALGVKAGRAGRLYRDLTGGAGSPQELQRAQGSAGASEVGALLKQTAMAATLAKTTGVDSATATAAVQQEDGFVANPYIIAAYKGPSDLREHKFTFKMMPQDIAESKTCVAIVASFKQAMLPAHGGGDSMVSPSMLFSYPDEFLISYYINGHRLPDNDTNPMFHIDRSVLTSCDLNYTTQDLPLFFEGTQYPVSIEMTLTFMEIAVMHRHKAEHGF